MSPGLAGIDQIADLLQIGRKYEHPKLLKNLYKTHKMLVHDENESECLQWSCDETLADMRQRAASEIM